MKKIAIAIIFLCALISVGGCAPMSKTLEKIKGQDGLFAVIETSKGDILLELFYKETPLTVTNFVGLAEGTLTAANKKPFYNGLKFHRVISVANGDGQDFMIQGGDPDGNGTGGSKDTIVGEFSSNGHSNDISHIRGVISMARSNDPDSASSQFFICNADASTSLDGSYAAFGYVIKGMSVIDKITENVFPKTAYAEYYGNYKYDSYYGITYHEIWNYIGNGTVEKDADKPVIEYIKVLDNYRH